MSINNFEIFDENFNVNSLPSETVYHNTKKLLELYSKVKWRVENSFAELESECVERYGNQISAAIDSLVCMNEDVELLKLEARIQNLAVSNLILEFINRSMILLKAYPENGMRYHDILSFAYLKDKECSENELLNKLHISRTTFYKDKKKAIKLLGSILWGFILPDVTGKYCNKIDNALVSSFER